MSELLDQILLHEGFSEKPYLDTVGVWTIGHGLTFITAEESEHIVANRLPKIQGRLRSAHPDYIEPVIDVMTEMVYQLGWVGTHKFKKMIEALDDANYCKAAGEGLDSKWAKQTPRRAGELMAILRDLA